jgi:hypothetical protein
MFQAQGAVSSTFRRGDRIGSSMARGWLWGAFLSAAALSAISCGRGADDGNFSQHPGFAEGYAANPPSEVLPGDQERALLARYQPRIFIAEGQQEPIDF